MADIKSINGNPIVVGTSGIEDGAATDEKLAQSGGVLADVGGLRKGEIDGYRHVSVWKNGSWHGMSLTNNSKRIRPDAFIDVKQGDTITITNGSYVHAVGLWSGTIDTHTEVRNDDSFVMSDETIFVAEDGFFIVSFALASDTTANIDPDDFDGGIDISSYSFRGFSNVDSRFSSVDSRISTIENDGKSIIEKSVVWQNGYTDSVGKIKSSTVSGFALVKLSKGETIEIWTNNSNITIIGSTTAESVSIGDTVTIIQKTLTSTFEKHIYTATSDINLVISVKKAEYKLLFYKNVYLMDSIIDGWFYGSVVVNGSFLSNGTLTTNIQNRIRTDFIPFKAYDKIHIENGSFEHAVCMWNGTPSSATNTRNDGTWEQDETIVPDYDGFICIVFRKSTDANVTIKDFDGQIQLYQTVGYRAYASVKYDHSEIELPSYYYTDDYISDKAARINAIGKTGDDVFAFITDIHWELNARQSPKLLKYLSHECSLFKIFNGGDVADSSEMNVYKRYRNTIDGRTYYAAGNHDWFSPATGKDLYYGMDSANNDQIGNAFMHYWYTDNVQQKIRYIVLNPFCREDGESSIVSGFDSDQINWFTDTALDVPSDWDVIVFTHFLRTTTLNITNGTLVESAIASFNSDGGRTGKVLAVFQGHTHWDAVYHTTSGVPVITTTCDKWDLSNESELSQEQPGRVFGTISEQAFDVVILNRSAKTFTCVRVGAKAQNNIDKYRTDPDFEWIGSLEERTISYDAS